MFWKLLWGVGFSQRRWLFSSKRIWFFLVLFFIHQGVSLHAQTFKGEGGIILDYIGERSPTLYELVVEGLPEVSSGGYGVESICLHIRHGRTRDLKIELLSPSGTLVWLSNRNEDPLKYGYFETCFKQQGFNGHVIQPTARFSGEFSPEGRIEYYNSGENLNGSWFLIVSDLEEGEIGKLLEWSITFGDNPAASDHELCSDPDIYNCIKENFNQGHQFLPDLVLSKKLTIENVVYFSDAHPDTTYRNQLRFAAAMANIGEGPLEVTGEGEWRCNDTIGIRTKPCPDGSYPRQQVMQNIYVLGEKSLIKKKNLGGTMYYDTKPGHNHFHADHWVKYSLLKKKWWRKDPKKWKVISTSNKVSYCLYDNMICTQENEYCRNNNVVYSQQNLNNFGFGNFTSCNSQKQGISVGGIDYYGKFYEGQSLSIPPDIKCGTYYLYIEIDPQNYYQESREDNNTEVVKIVIKEDLKGVKYIER